MIAYVRGEVERLIEGAAIVDCGGVGYLVYVSPQTLGRLSGMKNVKLYTYQQVKEDGVSLFGFLSFDELNMFNRLISVSGVGPKSAMAALSHMSPADIMLAILTDDDAALSKIPGIGKKTAQRIILDLKDKLKSSERLSGGIEYAAGANLTLEGGERSDAIAALASLGYSRADAIKAVNAVAADGMTTEQLLRAALRKLSMI